MKWSRSLPEIWASTVCPFTSSTRNIALGSASITFPSTSMASFFGKSGLPPAYRLIALVSTYHLWQCKYLWPVFAYSYSVLEMGR